MMRRRLIRRGLVVAGSRVLPSISISTVLVIWVVVLVVAAVSTLLVGIARAGVLLHPPTVAAIIAIAVTAAVFIPAVVCVPGEPGSHIFILHVLLITPLVLAIIDVVR